MRHSCWSRFFKDKEGDDITREKVDDNLGDTNKAGDDGPNDIELN